jgi:hypothetical protein
VLSRCCVFLFRKVHPALRYLKQNSPFLCVLDPLGSVHTFLRMPPIFFCLTRQDYSCPCIR